MATLTTRFKWASPDRYEILKAFARENRKHQTPAEEELWEAVRKNRLGVEIRRQQIIYDYIADFVCLDKMLVIEVDGGYHAEREQQEDDEARTFNLEKIGFRVIRFKNEEILTDLEMVLTKIKQELSK